MTRSLKGSLRYRLFGAFAAAAAAAVFMVGCSDNGNPSAPLGNGPVFNKATVSYLAPQQGNAAYVNGFPWYNGLPAKALVSDRQELEKYYQTCLRGHDVMDVMVNELGCTGVLDSYTDSFFESRQLIALVLSANSGSNSFEVTGVEHKNQAFTVRVNQNIPFVGTSDMKSWLILIELNTTYPANTGIVVNVTDVVAGG